MERIKDETEILAMKQKLRKKYRETSELDNVTTEINN